jgi:cell division septum initiation protein DivIVA
MMNPKEVHDKLEALESRFRQLKQRIRQLKQRNAEMAKVLEGVEADFALKGNINRDRYWQIKQALNQPEGI